MKLLTAIKTKIQEIQNQIETKKLYEELENRINDLKNENIIRSINTIANYLVDDQLDRTGILYSPHDNYITTKAQSLFWEWRDEGIINEFENFNETTWSWIKEYAK